jgi:hypothetical protein
MVIASPISAADAAKATRLVVPRITDVAMDEHQVVHGRVLNDSSAPIPGAGIEVFQGAKQVGQVMADECGQFQWKCAGGGTYHLLTNGQVTTVRIWTAAAAPPHSVKHVALVPGQVARGQSGTFPYTQVNPWVVAGVVAAAVAIPVVLHNNRTDEGEGS